MIYLWMIHLWMIYLICLTCESNSQFMMCCRLLYYCISKSKNFSFFAIRYFNTGGGRPFSARDCESLTVSDQPAAALFSLFLRPIFGGGQFARRLPPPPWNKA